MTPCATKEQKQKRSSWKAHQSQSYQTLLVSDAFLQGNGLSLISLYGTADRIPSGASILVDDPTWRDATRRSSGGEAIGIALSERPSLLLIMHLQIGQHAFRLQGDNLPLGSSGEITDFDTIAIRSSHLELFLPRNCAANRD